MDLSVYRYSTQEGRNYGSSLSRAATSGRSRRIPHRYGDDVGEHVPLGARKTPHDAQQDGEQPYCGRRHRLRRHRHHSEFVRHDRHGRRSRQRRNHDALSGDRHHHGREHRHDHHGVDRLARQSRCFGVPARSDRRRRVHDDARQARTRESRRQYPRGAWPYFRGTFGHARWTPICTPRS